MKWLLAIFAFSVQISAQAAGLPEPLVRVRIDKSLEKIELEGSAISFQGENQTSQLIAIENQQSRWSISRLQRNSHSFWNLTDGKKQRWIGEKYLIITGQGLRLNGRPVPNHLILAAKEKMDVIAAVPLNDYVLGVVAKEMPLQWPLEALKAQAIATRSYTLAMLQERKNQLFQVESSVLDQVFAHLPDRQLNSTQLDSVKKAVEGTKFTVLKSKDGTKVLKAYYHSDCGGHTSSSRNVFGVAGLAGGAVDESCPLNPSGKWSFELSREQLQELMSKNLHQELGKIASLNLVRPHAKERVHSIQLTLEDGTSKTIDAQKFRDWMGYSRLRSTLFEVQSTGGSFRFKGSGFGHGVGLCQWGARSLAQKGKSADEILRHYYPEATIAAPSLDQGHDLQSKEAHSHQDQPVLN